MKYKVTTNSSRRRFIKQLGLGLASIPLIGLVACGGGSDSTETASTETGSSDSSGSTGGSTGSSTSWASGGTAAMTANFPDDSLFALGTACTVALTKNLTEGPCYFTAETLDDISEEQSGLPMQLCLRVIDTSCNPISGLEVEVWHCDVEGIYSGDTSGSSDSSGFSSSFCTGNDSEALRSKWFRGTQISDSNGRVNFKSCFPAGIRDGLSIFTSESAITITMKWCHSFVSRMHSLQKFAPLTPTTAAVVFRTPH